MNKKFNIIFFSVFIVLWLGVTVVNLFTPYKSFSENENKALSKFPKFSFAKIVNGEYMPKVEDYLNEQFIIRDSWISMQSILEVAVGKRESNGVYICDDQLIGKINKPDDEFVNNNIDGANSIIEKLGINAYMMLIPSASDIQKDRLPLCASPWEQKPLIDSIFSRVNAKKVSVYETLTEHKDEYIFYNTDHHWTTYGAYLGYVEFCKAAGLTPLEYSAEKVSDSFNGTLYSKSGVRFFSSDSMERFNIKFDTTCTVVTSKDQGVTNDSVYYEENLQIKDKYTYYLGDNMAVVTARANNGNNKKLLVIKDSYAHCMAPMLLAHYDEVTFVDQRYIKFDLSYYTDPSLYDDLLILFSVDGFGQNDLKALSVYINEETK